MAKIKRKSRVLVVLFLLVCGYAGWRLITSHEFLMTSVEKILREQFAGPVRLDQVSVGIFSGAEVKNFRVKSRRQPGRDLLRVKSLRLEHSVRALLRGRFVIEDLTIDNPVLFATRKANGEWEMEDVFNFHSTQGYKNLRISSVTIRDAAFKLQDERPNARGAELLNVGGLHILALAMPTVRGGFLLRGKIKQSLIGECFITGYVDLQKNYFEAITTRHGLPLDPKLSNAFTPFLPDWLRPLCFEGGTADLQFRLSYNMAPKGEIDYSSLVSLHHANTTIGESAIEVKDVVGEAQVGRDVVECPGLSGLINGAPFRARGSIARNRARAATDFTMTVTDLPVNQRLKGLGGGRLASLWEAMRPSGKVDLKWRELAPPDPSQEAQKSLLAVLKDCSITPREVPRTVSGINGTVEWTGKSVAWKGIQGRLGDNPVRVRDGVYVVDGKSPLTAEMDVTDLVIDEQFFRALPEQNRRLWKDYGVAGRTDALAKFTRTPGPDGQFSLSILCDWKDMRLAYPMLKQPFEHLKGKMRMGGGEFIIEHAEGVCGNRTVILSGVRMDATHPNPTAGTITIKDWAIDEELMSFVPKDVKPIVDDLHAEGIVDVVYRIVPPKNGQESPPEMNLVLRNGSVQHGSFPYRVRNLQGRLIITASAIHLEGMEARDGDMLFTMPDCVLDTSGKNPAVIQVCGRNLALDQNLRSALSKDSQRMWEQFSPRGRINADVRVEIMPGRNTPTVTASVECSGCELTYKLFPYTIRNVRGTVTFATDGIELRGVSGEPVNGRLAFEDTKLHFDETKGMTFTIRGTDLRFDDELYKCLPEEFRATWDTISPEGAFDLVWHQERKPGKNQVSELDVSITLKGCNMKYKPLPYQLTDLRGVLVYDGQKVAIQDVSGRSGEARFNILGRVSDPLAEGDVRVTVIGKNVALDAKLRDALPPDYHGLWERLKPSGHISFECTVGHRTDEKGERYLEYDVPRLEGKDCKVDLGLPITITDGVMNVTAKIRNNPNLTTAEGGIVLKHTKVENMTFNLIRAKFTDDAQNLHVTGLQAECYGGKAAGEFTIRKGETLKDAGFEAFFEANDLNAGAMVSDVVPEVKGVEGRLSSEMKAGGRRFDTDDLNADGSLQIIDGNLGTLPKLLGLLQRLQGLPPNAAAFKAAKLGYDVRDKQARIKYADLTGPAFSLHGKGKIGFDGSLRMEFRPDFGPDSRKFPVVGDLLRLVAAGVIPVTLTGTLKDPIWKVEPLLPLVKVVKGIGRLFEVRPRPRADLPAAAPK